MSDTRPPLAQPYSPWITLWKALRPVLVIGLLSFLTTVAENVDTQTLATIGIPSGIAFFMLEGARNYLKNRNRTVVLVRRQPEAVPVVVVQSADQDVVVKSVEPPK